MRFIVFNKAFKAIFEKNWGKELRLGMTLQDAHANNPAEAEKLITLWKRCFKEHVVIETQINSDFYEIRGGPIFDDHGVLIGAAHIAHNISLRVKANKVNLLATQKLEQSVEERTMQLAQSHALLEQETETRKQVQHALEESEIRYRTLAQATNAVTWTWNEKGQFCKPVPSWENFTGQTWPAYEHGGWLNAFPKECQCNLKQELENSMQTKATYRTIAKLWSKSENSFRHVLIHVTPIYKQHPHEIVEWVGAAVDIHALKQAEEDLRNLSQRLNLTLKSAGIGTWSYDPITHHAVLDPATAALFGVDWLEGPVENLVAVVHDEDKEAVCACMRECVEGHKMYDTEFRVSHKDGTVRYLSGRGEIVTDSLTGKKIVFGINLDVTDRKKLETDKLEAIKQAKEQQRIRAEEAERNQKRQQEFVDTICHEIRNPLSGIVGGADLLKEALREAEDIANTLDPSQKEGLKKMLNLAEEYLDSITKSAHQQKAIVDDVLDMSRLISNKLELKFSPVDLKTTLPSLIQMFHPQVTLKGLSMSLHLPSEPLVVSTDILRLNQVILNLISNAVKFTEKGGITLRVTKEIVLSDVQLHFEVSDSGIGIPQDELSKIFEKFVTSQTRSTHGGTGLGLAISKSIVEAFGGTISAKSRVSGGTTFMFTIPCKEVSPLEWRASSPPRTAQQPAVVSDPLNILIVEDNAVNQKILLTYLTRQNYFCQVAWNGVEALEKFNQYTFDLIFMDVEMPVMDGIAATVAIRNQEKKGTGKRVPIVGLSGNARQAQQQEALDAGMDDYLTKPYHRDEVFALVAKYAARQK